MTYTSINIRAFLVCLMIFIMPFICAESYVDKPFIKGNLRERLGNQLFIVAANISLALDNDARAIFPEFLWRTDSDIGENYKMIFWRLDVAEPDSSISFDYCEPSLLYAPIPYVPNMQTNGWFASEKHFKHHKSEILALFAPHPDIVNYLKSKYQDILEHPNTVAIHVRAYFLESSYAAQNFVSYKKDYFEKAMSLFPEDTLFVVFSDKMNWCKQEFAKIKTINNIRFIENEKHYHDIFLMSMCKHNILSNSTFSWWGAYLNNNPNKIVIAPPKWFCPESSFQDLPDLFPEEWFILK